jgi:predicted XRE-type DNA-binding protein
MGCNGTGRTATRYRLDAGPLFTLLTAKQQIIMAYRLGFADGKAWKQTELASFLGITQPAVSKHERLANRKLRQKVVNTLGLQHTDGYISHVGRPEHIQFSPQSGSNAVLKELRGLRRDVARLVHEADLNELRWHNLLMRHSLGDLTEDAEASS